MAAMGGGVPVDSVARGTITIEAGSSTETGKLTISTRGTGQSAEVLEMADSQRKIMYSNGLASDGITGKPLQLELAVTSQTSLNPIQLIAAALNDLEGAFEYVSAEKLEGRPVHHVRFWNTFETKPRLRHLAEFSRKDIWIDANSNLPVKLAFVRRSGRGPGTLAVPIEVFYRSYQVEGGFLFPARVETSHNGTPYSVVTIEQIILNSGLSDVDFPIGTRRAQ
jgi:hypothetical protein